MRIECTNEPRIAKNAKIFSRIQNRIMSFELFFALYISMRKLSTMKHMVRCLVFSISEQYTMLSKIWYDFAM